MLKVRLDQDNHTLKLLLDGHAGQADIGHDIVCSACSILAYTLAQYVKCAEAEGGLACPPYITLDSGYAVVECEPREDYFDGIYGAYQFAQLGYILLEHNYPQFVELTQFGTEDSVNINQKDSLT